MQKGHMTNHRCVEVVEHRPSGVEAGAVHSTAVAPNIVVDLSSTARTVLWVKKFLSLWQKQNREV